MATAVETTAQTEETPTEVEAAGERRLRMTYEEFLAWADEDVHAEWVDGEVTLLMPPDERHADIALFLASVLSAYVRRLRLGKVFVAPFEMRLPSGRSSREPDVLFVAESHRQRLTGQRLAGAADLAVELISDGSIGRDRGDKFYEYEEAGVLEYLLIDPRPGKERIDLYRLGPDGKYQPILPGDDGRYSLESVPGFWVDRAWLFSDPLPDVLEVLEALLAGRMPIGLRGRPEGKRAAGEPQG